MNDSVSQEETKRFATKQILVTLKKGFGNCTTITDITPIRENQGVEMMDGKLVMTNRWVDIKPGKTSPVMKARSKFNTPLVSEIEMCSKSGTISCQNKSSLKKNPTDDETNSGNKNLGSTTNKQDRFVPNILKTQRTSENTVDANSLNPSHSMRTTIALEKDLRYNDHKNLKRNRKQILKPLNTKHDFVQAMQIRCEKKKVDRSLPGKRSSKSTKKNYTQAFGRKTLNVEEENCNKHLAIRSEDSGDAEKITTNLKNANNIYSADLKVFSRFHDSSGAGKAGVTRDNESMKQVFAEFEIPDYESYIASEDRSFNVDEMDKLVSSDIDGSSLIESIFHRHAGKVEYDMNGNDIENYDDSMMTELYYDDEMEPTINTAVTMKCETTLDDIFHDWDNTSCYETSEINPWSTDLDESNCSDDFRRSSSSTDTASGSETDQLSSFQDLNCVLSRKKNIGRRGTLLTVSDVTTESNRFYSYNLEQNNCHSPRIKSSSIMQRNDGNESIVSKNSPCKSWEMITNNFKLFDDLGAPLEFSVDSDFSVDNKLNVNHVVSHENEKRERILDDSNAEFNHNNISNISNYVIDTSNESSQNDELESSNGESSATGFLSPVTVKKYDPNEMIILKLESLLTRSETCKNYSRACNPISRDAETDSKISGDQLCSKVVGYRGIDTPDSAEGEKSAGQETVANFNDDCCVTTRRNDQLFGKESTHKQHSFNCSSISHPVSSNKVSFVLRKPERGSSDGFTEENDRTTVNESLSTFCKSCDKQCGSDVDLADHMKVEHKYRRLNFGSKKKRYVCSRCSKKYCLAKAMEKHFEMHDNYILTCRICEAHFSERAQLYRHYNNFHQVEKFECCYCGKRCTEKDLFLEHLNVCQGISESVP